MLKDPFERDGWNMYMAYYQHVCEIIILCGQAEMENDYTKWFQLLKLLYRRIHGRLKKAGRKECEQIEKLLKDITDDLQKEGYWQGSMDIRNDVWKNLDQLEELLLDVLHDEGVLPTSPLKLDPGNAMERGAFH